jgi:hypothetical protein
MMAVAAVVLAQLVELEPEVVAVGVVATAQPHPSLVVP